MCNLKWISHTFKVNLEAKWTLYLFIFCISEHHSSSGGHWIIWEMKQRMPSSQNINYVTDRGPVEDGAWSHPCGLLSAAHQSQAGLGHLLPIGRGPEEVGTTTLADNLPSRGGKDVEPILTHFPFLFPQSDKAFFPWQGVC